MAGSKTDGEGDYYEEYDYDYEWITDENGNPVRTRGAPPRSQIDAVLISSRGPVLNMSASVCAGQYCGCDVSASGLQR